MKSCRNNQRPPELGGRTLLRGAILLETILALLFVVLTVGAVAGLFRNSLHQIRQSELRTRALLLAENKLAELEAGLVDLTDTNEGDFSGKPEKFIWKVELEPTQVPELQRLKVTVTYDDPADGFTSTLIRLYSSSLNLSAEKMKEIANDPVKMQAMGTSSEGLTNLMSMLAELPFGDKLAEALNRGGMFGLIGMFNKVASGRIALEELLVALESEAGDNPFGMMTVRRDKGGRGSPPLAWSNYDTAGIGSPPATAWGGRFASRRSADRARARQDQAGPPESPGMEPDRQPEQPPEADTASADRGRRGPRSDERNPVMTREEAIQRMQEMLRRLANQRK